jgi:hypothetical protein
VLEALRIRLGIATKVVRRSKHGHNQLDTTNSRAIANIGSFFNGQMKGMKAVEFQIWLRSQRHKGDFSELERVQSLLRRLRRVRASQSLWDSADSKKDKMDEGLVRSSWKHGACSDTLLVLVRSKFTFKERLNRVY